MWRSKFKKFRGEGERNGKRANNTEDDKKKRRKKEFRFLVVNPFSNFFVQKAYRRRLANWQETERNRVGANKDESPGRPQAETFRSGTRRPGNLGRPQCERYETGWQDPELCLDGMGRKKRTTGTDFVTKGSAGVDGMVSGTRTESEKTALEYENVVDLCRDIVSATETWDHRYQAYRYQVATDLYSAKQHSIGDDLFRLRNGRREVFKKLQEFGYIDSKAAVDDVFIVRGFDRLCRDVCEWRRQAINSLRLRHKQMDDATEAEEEQVRHLMAARRHIDNYKTRIEQRLAANDIEIELLTQQLEAAQALSYTAKIDNRPPVQPESVFTNHKVTSRVFRGCFSSDVTYWAQRTAIFPDKIRESMLEKAMSKVRTKADTESKRRPHLRTPQVGPESAPETVNRPLELEDEDDEDFW